MRIADILYFSPEDKFSDLDWGDKKSLITAFKNRIEGFYLEPAKQLNKDKKGFGTGVLCVTTIDFLARIATGLDSVSERISKWLKNNVMEFKEADPANPGKTLADRFYYDFRNGLVHEGRIKKAGQFSYDFHEKMIIISDGVMIVNPDLLLQKIDSSFKEYVSQVEREEFAFQELRCALIRDFKDDVELARSVVR